MCTHLHLGSIKRNLEGRYLLVKWVLNVRVSLEAGVAVNDALAGLAADSERVADHAPLRLVVECHHLREPMWCYNIIQYNNYLLVYGYHKYKVQTRQ